jgi:hypothetical protein
LWTFFTMLLFASIALVLFFSTLEPRTAPATGPRRAGRRRPRPRRKATTQRKAGAGRRPAARRTVRSSRSGTGTTRGRPGRKRRR